MGSKSRRNLNFFASASGQEGRLHWEVDIHYLFVERERGFLKRERATSCTLLDWKGAQHKQKEKSWPPRTRLNENHTLAKSSTLQVPPDATLTTNRCSCFNERERALAAWRSSSSQRASWKAGQCTGNENQLRIN